MPTPQNPLCVFIEKKKKRNLPTHPSPRKTITDRDDKGTTTGERLVILSIATIQGLPVRLLCPKGQDLLSAVHGW